MRGETLKLHAEVTWSTPSSGLPVALVLLPKDLVRPRRSAWSDELIEALDLRHDLLPRSPRPSRSRAP
jgi:hypothetical protein